MAGNFYESAIDVRVEGPVLFARLRTIDGEEVDASIDLNQHLGNSNGISPCLCCLKPTQPLTMSLWLRLL